MKIQKLLSAILIITLATPATAGTKEQLIQLQTQVDALEDSMARMQQSFDERMGVMRSLIEQTTDNINKTTAAIDALNKNLQTVGAGNDDKAEQLSLQIQTLQDSVDELKTRLNKVSTQLDEMNAVRENLTAGTPEQMQAPPADMLYNDALRDYNAAKYDLAMQEFADYIKFYPQTDLAGNAQYYLADIYYKQKNYQAAVTEYDKVLEQYPGGNKTAAAQLKKGFALLELGQKDAGVKELNSLINRYPRSAEATQARDRLKKVAPTTTRRRAGQ